MSREPRDVVDHEHVEELLAGYALRSLSGEDGMEADRLLSRHVPDCTRCRETLLTFSDTVADLGLAVDPVAPPETLLPRLRRELEPRASRSDARRRVGLVAGFVAVLVTGGLAVSQGLRASDLEERNRLFTQALQLAQRPDADTARLEQVGASNAAPVSAVSAPEVDHFFLVGNDLPAPPEGFVYGVWLSSRAGDDQVFAGSFRPQTGLTVIRVPFDRFRFDRVLITLERRDAVPAGPGEVLWQEAAVA